MVLCAGMLMIILDATIVNVALPAIQTDLGFSQPNLAWVVNAYLIAFGGLLLLAGRLGDLLGRKRLFLNGLVVFTTASLFCGLANSQNVLITARFIQGAGGALASAGILGMIVTMFREPAEQAKAIGVYSFVAAAGGSIGLIAGGILTQALNWHWIFFVNLPIGIATGICASRLLPRERGSRLGDGADVVGAALITAAFDAGCLHDRAVGRSWMGIGSYDDVRRRVPRTTRPVLAYLPLTAGIAVLSLGAAPSMITRFGARTVLVPGLLLILIGLGLSARMPVRGSYWLDIFPSMLTVGIGAGLTFPAVMTLAMAGVQPHQAGLASGLANTTQQVGGALGLAMLATLASSRSNHLALHGESVGRSLTGGYHLAFTVGGALIVVAALVAATLMGPERTVVAAEEIFVPVTASEECPRRVSIAPRRWARWRDRGLAMSRRCAESVAPPPLPDASPDIA
jgi:MFS family permease